MKLSEAISALESGSMIHAGDRVLCALSGGADSVALVNILHNAALKVGYELFAAHVHHGIRRESDEELEFVSRLCTQMGVELFTLRVDVPSIAKSSGESIESAARRVRYDFFYKTAQENHLNLIALAHHSRDQAETVLMHALRGASVSGLVGMRSRVGMLIRPLLDVDPEELRAYLAEHKLEFREDATNSDIRYTRNYVRHVILPTCENAYPGSRAGLCRLARAAKRDDDYMNAVADAAADRCMFDYPGGQYISIAKFRNEHPAIQARIAAKAMKRAGQDPEQAGIDRILASLDGQNTNLPGDIRVSRGAARIYLEYLGKCRGGRLIDALEEEHFIDTAALPMHVECSLGTLAIEPARYDTGEGLSLGSGLWEQAIDADALTGACLRFRHAGDVICPFGAPGDKKLKDFYIDRKVDRQIRGFLPVLAKGSRILWALGVGAARECAVNADTKRVAFMQWQGRKFW